jgi:two-component system sensor histidine kinase/response regulator
MEQGIDRQTSQSLRVLVVDDNIINQKVAMKMLQRLHVQPDVVVDGLQALEAVKANRYDLVLMDVQMPVMDGLEATRAIREFEQGDRHTIIVAVTANAIQGDKERCLRSGMDDYLPKPIKQQDIELMITKWISASVTAKEISAKNSVPAELIDPVRIEQIMEIGDESLLTELFALYLGDINQYPSEVLTALEEGNFRSIYENSHKLKGSSANIGVETIRQACITMEECSKTEDPALVRKQLSAMQELIERISLHIRSKYSVP